MAASSTTKVPADEQRHQISLTPRAASGPSKYTEKFIAALDDYLTDTEDLSRSHLHGIATIWSAAEFLVTFEPINYDAVNILVDQMRQACARFKESGGEVPASLTKFVGVEGLEKLIGDLKLAHIREREKSESPLPECSD